MNSRKIIWNYDGSWRILGNVQVQEFVNQVAFAFGKLRMENVNSDSSGWHDKHYHEQSCGCFILSARQKSRWNNRHLVSSISSFKQGFIHSVRCWRQISWDVNLNLQDQLTMLDKVFCSRWRPTLIILMLNKRKSEYKTNGETQLIKYFHILKILLLHIN